MNDDRKMILGYIVGGLIVLVLVPSVIYFITSLFDNIYRVEIFHNPVIRWILFILLLVTGLIYGIWSIAVQNIIGKGGPVEIGNIEISPKTKVLVVSGPYKYTRNPMLFGAFLAYLGVAFFMNSVTSVVLVCIIFALMLKFVMKMEEKRLLHDFGDKYKEYQKKTSKFIPWPTRK